MDERPTAPQRKTETKAIRRATEPSLGDLGLAFGKALRARADHAMAKQADKAFIDSLYGEPGDDG